MTTPTFLLNDLLIWLFILLFCVTFLHVHLTGKHIKKLHVQLKKKDVVIKIHETAIDETIKLLERETAIAHKRNQDENRFEITRTEIYKYNQN